MPADPTKPNPGDPESAPRGPASMPLRPLEPIGGGDDEFDPANRSLASALRISFIALQIVMVVLIAMYFFSGWRQVPEQSKGLRLLFGRVQDAEPLDAGGYFVWPYPIGDFVLVESSQQTASLETEFWPQLSTAQKAKPFREIHETEKMSLVPGNDGSVITSDHNLAHTSWNVQYRIVDARQNQEVVRKDMNRSFVRKAVERGVVLGAAECTLDEIIQSRDKLSGKVKAYAQEFLDRLDCGIEVTTASYEAYPPVPAMASYERVNQAHIGSAQLKVEAERKASEILNAVAGPAYQQLRQLISEYELLLAQAKGDPELTSAADAKRAEINALLVSDAVGGKIATIIGMAKSERGELVSSFRSDLARFNAWIDQYEQTPMLAISMLWTESMVRISKSNFEWFSLAPETTMIDIETNPDPARTRRMKSEQYIKDIQSMN